jgi:hypothetical protein
VIALGMERTTAVRTVASLGATDSVEAAAHADSDATQAVAPPRRCSEPLQDDLADGAAALSARA